MITVCLTHDVDRIDKTYQYLTKSFRALSKGQFGVIKKQVSSFYSKKNSYWGFEEVLEIENAANVKSTFFFLNESLTFNPFDWKNWKLSQGRYDFSDSRIIKIIKELHFNEWEIGLHGSYNSYQDSGLLLFEKASLEEIVGSKVQGVRQHYLNLNQMTWQLQDNAGFLYDSSWGFTSNIGFKDNKILPFKPNANSDFLVIPLQIMDYPFVIYPDKWDRLDQIIKTLNQSNGVLVVNFHTNNYCDVDHQNVKPVYLELLSRLKDVGAVFKTMNQVVSTYV